MNHDERNAATAAFLLVSSREDALHASGMTTAATGGGSAEDTFFRQRYRNTDYYSTGRDWGDYAPAYRYGNLAHTLHPGERFEDVETMLAEQWCTAKGGSRLLWAEARGAVLDAWRQLDGSAVVPAFDAGEG